MTTAHHGTPITPLAVLELLSGRNFCVSFYRPDQVEIVARIAASWFIDCGAFSAWKQGLVLDAAYWALYYEFVRHWLARGCGWFVIPDVINAGSQLQDALLRECPADLKPFGAPVWHMDEPISRLLTLADEFARVCIGSTAEYAVVGSPAWRERMDEAWDALRARQGPRPRIHMLRGLQCELPSYDYPFDSVDSTHMGRNHNRLNRFGDDKPWAVKQFADRWDRLNCPLRWEPEKRMRQADLMEIAS
jgi:hypothetical protein